MFLLIKPAFRTINFFLILQILIFTNCTWQADYKEAARLSLQPDTDLILVPYEHGIFDAFEKDRQHTAHYDPKKLKEILVQQGIENKAIWKKINESTDGKELALDVQYTSHYTNYAYDTKIPLLFYGEPFFRPGIYSDPIDQEQIVPILSSLLHLSETRHSLFQKIGKAKPKHPKIVVTIVIDQGGRMVLDQTPTTFPFIQSLQTKSAVFSKARVTHLEAHTAVGHSAIGTGAYPNETQVLSNEVYFWKNGKVVRKPIYEPVNGVWNLQDLKSLSLADRLSKANYFKSIVISQCYAPRAAIGMAGHGGKGHFVYWADKKSGGWGTEPTFYQLPEVLKKESFYAFYQRNKNEWNRDFVFKDEKDFYSNLSEFQASTLQVKLDEEAFIKTIQSEILDKGLHLDYDPDLAYLTLKATDAIGHQFGWESEEARAVQRATDQSIERIFQFLKENFQDDFVLVITADHGAAVMPELSGVSKLSHASFFDQLGTLIPEKYRAEDSVIKWVTHSQVSLDRNVMQRYKISEDQVVSEIKKLKSEKGTLFFREVWRRKDVE